MKPIHVSVGICENTDTRLFPVRCRRALTAGPDAPREVRRILRAHLRLWRMPESADAAELAVTELLANVAAHVPDGRCAVTVRRRPAGVRVEVRDTSPLLPALREAGEWEESGRGLALVAAVTDRWGAELPAVGGVGGGSGGGKTVWFEIDAAPAPAVLPGPAPDRQVPEACSPNGPCTKTR
ncbi:ATP-binding protein [Streptomyces thermolineatus]|uniref:ATP-binding protein n=1 Tax=Streptomyces thermolineatus TaxID=44033 RepID=A0ABP5Z8E7_9ACTN